MILDPTGQQPEGKDSSGSGPARLGLLPIIAGTLLLTVATVAGAYVFGGLTGVSTKGIIALILGVTFSYALGVGLMAAIFHSSRFYDESAHKAAREQFKDHLDGP